MLEKYIIMNAPYSPAFMEVVRNNKKQFRASWYVFYNVYTFISFLVIKK